MPGCKQVLTTKHRKITDEIECADKLLTEGVSPNKLFKRQLLSPAQLEKNVGKDNLETLQHYIEKPAGDRVLALMDDKRPAVATSKDIFKNG